MLRIHQPLSQQFYLAISNITCSCRGHEIYEVKQGLAILVLGWMSANILKCWSFPAGSIGWELYASYFAAEKETMYKIQITLPLLWCNKLVVTMLVFKLGVKTEVMSEVKL